MIHQEKTNRQEVIASLLTIYQVVQASTCTALYSTGTLLTMINLFIPYNCKSAIKHVYNEPTRLIIVPFNSLTDSGITQFNNSHSKHQHNTATLSALSPSLSHALSGCIYTAHHVPVLMFYLHLTVV